MRTFRSMLAVFLGLWLAGCSGRTSGSGSELELDIQPASLEFQAFEGGAPPEPQPVRATFNGADVVVGFVPGEEQVSWFDVTHESSDERSATFAFSINTTSLPPGDYSTRVRFVTGREQGKDAEFKDMAIRYTVLPMSRPLTVSPQGLEFSARANQADLPAARSVSVSGGASRFTIFVDYSGGPPDWLLVPASGTSPQTLDIRPSTTALSPGHYYATVHILPDDGSLGVQVGVSYTVSASSFFVSPARVDFRAVSGGNVLPAAQDVSVTGTPGLPALFSVTAEYSGDAQDWLSFPTSAVTPETIRLQPKSTYLNPGTYSAVLTLTPANNLPPARLTVTYTVTVPGISVVASPELGFSAYSGQPTLPAPWSASVFSEQGVPVRYQVSATYGGSAQGWLSFTSSGTAPTGITLRANTTTLPAGEHTATVRLTPDNGSPTVTLTVTYSIRAAELFVSSTQLGFSAYRGQPALPAARDVSVTAEQGMPVLYQVSVTYGASAREWLDVPSSGVTPHTLSLRPNTTSLPAGQHSATVRLTPDNGRSPLTLTVTYSLQAPELFVSPAQLSFTAASGQASRPPAQSVSVTAQQDASAAFEVSATYSGSARDWLTFATSGTTPQSLSIRPNTTALSAGQYSAVVHVNPGNGRPAAQVAVTYTVSASELRAAPNAPALRVDASTTEAQLTTRLALTSTGAPLSWRVVSVNAPWLEGAPASGDTQSGTGLDLTVRKDALAELANGTHTGTVTLAYSTATTAERQLVVNVTLSLSLPQVRTVTPYYIEAGRAYSHILRGEGFTGLRAMRFGTTTVDTLEVVSDTEIRLTVPALPEGAHTVQAGNVLGVSRPGATLHAVSTPAFAEASLPHATRSSRRTIYDPLRTAIYSVESNYENGAPMGLFRYRYVNGTWEEARYVYLPNIYDAVMDVDGQSLYMSIDTGLYRLDLDDSTATPRFIRTIAQYSELEVLNDGYLLVSSDCTNMVTPLDGRWTFIMGSGCYSLPVRLFHASTHEYETLPINTFVNFRQNLAMERTGRLAVISDSIYNAQWGLVSGLTPHHTMLNFSPDGRRLFGFYSDDSNRLRVRVYDVSVPPSGGQFPQLHDGPVNGGTVWDSYSGVALTPDGHTLMMVTRDRLYVWPIPSNLH